MSIDSHLWKQADEYWGRVDDEDLEPDCFDCEDEGYFYGKHGEIIRCHCETIPCWEKNGGYGWSETDETKADFPDDLPF